MSVIYTNAAERAAMRMKINVGRTSQVSNLEEERKALHEDIEIKCFYEGSTTLLIGTQTVTACAGDIVVINPYEFHATVACNTEESRYHLFMISLDYFSGNETEETDLRKRFLIDRTCLRTLFRQEPVLWNLLMEIANELTERNEAYQICIRGLMTQVLAFLLRNGLEKNTGSSVSHEMLRSYQLIEPALRHIRDNYAQVITVDQLATLCQVSKHYFCRVFKTVIGTPAMEYLQNYRLKVADTMLKNTDKTVGQIAGNCGFEDANYFSRCYKKHYGASPNKHRQKE